MRFKSEIVAPQLRALLVGATFTIGSALPATVMAEVIASHGISTFGELKYEQGFAHLDYVNPDAPKGGEISIWGFGSFDSMHPYTTKGRSGQLSSIFFESLLEGTADEADMSMVLLPSPLEYPEDRSHVIFNMRPRRVFPTAPR